MGFDYAFMLISPAAEYGKLLGELANRRFVQLQATAATTDMSLLFAQSASIQEAWIKLAAATGSYALFLDTEDSQTWALLYPEQRRVARPELEAQFQGDGHVIDTDSHCLTALRLAGLPPPAAGTGC